MLRCMNTAQAIITVSAPVNGCLEIVMNWLKGLLESKRVMMCMFSCFIIIILVLINKPESYHGIISVASVTSVYISGRTITGLKK